VDKLAQARFDGIIDVATPPTGDCNIPAAVEKMARGGKVLAGGIDCTTFILKDPDEFQRRAEALVNSVKDKHAYIFGSGDAVPQGATEENIRRAGALAKRTLL
jgi:uroporphyrinogen-III decarboxylase